MPARRDPRRGAAPPLRRGRAHRPHAGPRHAVRAHLERSDGPATHRGAPEPEHAGTEPRRPRARQRCPAGRGGVRRGAAGARRRPGGGDSGQAERRDVGAHRAPPRRASGLLRGPRPPRHGQRHAERRARPVAPGGHAPGGGRGDPSAPRAPRPPRPHQLAPPLLRGDVPVRDALGRLRTRSLRGARARRRRPSPPGRAALSGRALLPVDRPGRHRLPLCRDGGPDHGSPTASRPPGGASRATGAWRATPRAWSSRTTSCPSIRG